MDSVQGAVAAVPEYFWCQAGRVAGLRDTYHAVNLDTAQGDYSPRVELYTRTRRLTKAGQPKKGNGWRVWEYSYAGPVSEVLAQHGLLSPPEVDEPAAAPPAPKPVPVPAEHLASVRPLSLRELTKGLIGLARLARWCPLPTVRTGWLTDGCIAVRLTPGEQQTVETLLVSDGRDTDGRAVPVENILPTTLEPGEFRLVARVRVGPDDPPAALIRRDTDGAELVVSLIYWLTMVCRNPGHEVRRAEGESDSRPLVSVPPGLTLGCPPDAISGLVMPTLQDPGTQERWTAADVPVTVRTGTGAGSLSYTLPRRAWGTIRALLDGADTPEAIDARAGAICSAASGFAPAVTRTRYNAAGRKLVAVLAAVGAARLDEFRPYCVADPHHPEPELTP